MLAVTTFFLLVAILLYVLLGGADFGAGIVELFTPRKHRSTTENIVYKAIGPVWEANHMWLIIIIVILFVAFPKAYTDISTYLHWPMLLMLLGIVARGTTFAFRHYDAIQDGAQARYSLLFRWSSLVTPLFLGILAGAVILGRMETQPADFYHGFIRPWAHIFPMSVGLFFCAITALLAAAFLVGEVAVGPEQQYFAKVAQRWNLAAVLLGTVSLGLGYVYAPHVFRGLLTSPLYLVLMTGATVCLLQLFRALRLGQVQAARIWVSGEVVCILTGWLAHQFPALYYLNGNQPQSLYALAAPEATLSAIGIALIVGAVLFLPALGYLVWAFKYKPDKTIA